jgi:hypothetical protein
MKNQMKYLMAVFLTLITAFAVQAQPRQFVKKYNSYYSGFLQYTPPGYDPNGTKVYPTIIFLSGAGEKGDGSDAALDLLASAALPKQLRDGQDLVFTNPVTAAQEGFIVLAPQLPLDRPGWDDYRVDLMLSYAKDSLKTDLNRTYLMGISLGGSGIQRYIMSSVDRARKFAAIVQASPVCDFMTGPFDNVNKSGMGVWTFYNNDDVHTSAGDVASCANQFTNGLKNAVYPPMVQPKLTSYVASDHDSWTKAFDITHTYQSPNVFEWMLTFDRRTINDPPTVDAGLNKFFALPTNSVVLTATASDTKGGTIVSRGWSVVSGPSAPTLSGQSTDNLSATGLVQGTYVFRYTATDNQGAYNTADVSVQVLAAGTPMPIAIHPRFVYDIAGYSTPRNAGGNPYYMFDSRGTVDPIHDGGQNLPNQFKTRYLPFRVPENQFLQGTPHDIYNGMRGMRMIVDLAANKNTDAREFFNITNIVAWDNNGSTDDVMNVYDMTSIFQDTPVVNRWKYLSRPDSLMTPMMVITPTASYNWGGRWVNQAVTKNNVRFLMFVAYKKVRGPGWITFPEFLEVIVYGTKATNWTDHPETYATTIKPEPLQVNKFVGTNIGQAMRVPLLQADANVRAYGKLFNYDDDTTSFPNNHYNANNWGQSPAEQLYADSLKHSSQYYPGTTDKLYWESLPGSNFHFGAASKFYNDGVNSLNANNLPNITEIGMDPESPWSYERSGDFYKHYAAKFGKNTAGLTSAQLRWRNENGFTLGLNWYNVVENGNEMIFRGYTLPAYFWQSQVDYDGWEKRVCNCGIKSADTTMKFMMAGIVEIDTVSFNVLHFMSQVFRADKKFVWDYVNFHHYSRTYHKLDHHPTYDEQIGQKGASPEEIDLYGELVETENFIYDKLNGDTTKKIILTEYGYDQFPTAATTTAQLTIPWTTSGTPLIPGYDSSRSRAVMMVRSEALQMSAKLHFSTEFMFHNPYYLPFDNTNNGLFNSSGRTTGGLDAPVKTNWYWYRINFFKYLGNYKAEPLVRKDSIYMIRFRHVTKPDSVCYMVWKPTYNGTSYSNQTINVGTVLGGATKVNFSFTTTTGTETPKTLAAGFLNVPVKEEPDFYFMKETVLTSPGAPTVSAGGKKFITASSVGLNAAVTYGGSVSSTSWSKISGGAVTISNPNIVNPTLTGLAKGLYKFEVVVTTALNEVARDTVTVAVLPPDASTYDTKAKMIVYEDNGVMKIAYDAIIVKNAKGQAVGFILDKDKLTDMIDFKRKYIKVYGTYR